MADTRITWTPPEEKGNEPARLGEQAISLLRQNLPVPLLVGPNTAIRLNGVDIPQSPLRINDDGTLSLHQLGKVDDLVNLMGKENLGIKVSLVQPQKEDRGGKIGIEKEHGFWRKASLEVRDGVEAVVARPAIQGVSVFGNAAHFLVAVMKGDGNEAKKALWDTWNSLTAIPASLVGYICEKIPVRSVREFGEKLSNWSIGHAWGYTHAELRQLCQYDSSKKYGLFLGVGRGPTDVAGVNIDGNPQYYKDSLRKDLIRGAKNQERVIAVIKQIDIVPVYSGNLFADILYVACERSGWHLGTRHLDNQVSNPAYDVAIGHSGGAVRVREDDTGIKANVRAFIGAPGTESNWYRGADLVVAHDNDRITNIALREDGKEMGVSLNFRFGKGEGNILRTPGPESKMGLERESAHDVVNYMIKEVIPWLIERENQLSLH